MVETAKSKKIDKLSQADISYLTKTINVISKISFVILLLLVATPLIGLFIPTHTVESVYSLFKVKSYCVRVLGLAGLVISLYLIIPKIFLYGYKTVLYGLFKNPWNILFIFVIIWGAICFRSSFRVQNSLFGNATAYEGYLGYLSYGGIYLTASNITKDKDKNILFKILLIISTIIGVLTILSDSCGLTFIIDRGGMCFPYSGTFVNSNHYGYYLCACAAIALVMFMQQKTLKQSIIYFSCFILNMICLTMSNTFGSFLATLVMMIFVSIFFISKNKKDKNTYIKVFALWAITIPICAGLNREMVVEQIPGFFEDIMNVFINLGKAAKTGDVDSTIGSMSGNTDTKRIKVWVDSIKLILKNPIFGVGPDMALNAFFTNYGYVNLPHNDFLYVGVCMGIPAMAAYMVGIIYIIIKSLCNVKKMSASVLVGAIAMGTYAVSSLFGISLPIATFMYWMLMGFANSFFQSNIDKQLI